MSGKSKKRWLSPTAINTYLRCPRKFFLRYIRKLKSKPSIHLFRGTAVHEALADFNASPSSCQHSLAEQESRLLDLFNRAWQRLEPEMEAVGISQHEQRIFRDESTTMLRNWLRNQVSSGPFQARPKAEMKLFSKKHMLMGFLDLVLESPQGALLIDFKTSKSDRLTQEIERQLCIYALLYQERFGQKPYQVLAEFLKTGQKRGFIPTQAMIDETARMVADIHHKTQSREETDYPCTCGGWCDKDFITEDGGAKP